MYTYIFIKRAFTYKKYVGIYVFCSKSYDFTSFLHSVIYLNGIRKKFTQYILFGASLPHVQNGIYLFVTCRHINKGQYMEIIT